MQTTLVSRDPFARVELHRATIKTAQVCEWCGQRGRFLYRFETDGGRVSPWSLPFCSVACFRTYSE